MKRQIKARQDRRGAAVVEMALVLPLFMMVTLGIVEFGRAMMVSQIVANSAHRGARLAILDGSSNTEVEQMIRDFLVSAVGVSPGACTVTITVTPATGNPSAGNETANAQSKDLCTVHVAVPFTAVSFVTPKYLASSNLVGESAMRHE